MAGAFRTEPVIARLLKLSSGARPIQLVKLEFVAPGVVRRLVDDPKEILESSSVLQQPASDRAAASPEAAAETYASRRGRTLVQTWAQPPS